MNYEHIKRIGNTFNKITEYFPNLVKEIPIQIKEHHIDRTRKEC